MSKNINVVELFAGVGGFRVGLEKSSDRFKTIWANQWEPDKKTQHAFDCYVQHFGNSNTHINQDISTVKNQVPKHDLLVGGFPCQDYSVAQSGAKGIEGKKGVLWWEIRDIIEKQRPNYILLENVDRLIKSPTSQKGRDFGIILRCLSDLGYAVEWRIINAADYGQSQRRRRIFICAFKNTTKLFENLAKSLCSDENLLADWVLNNGLFAPAFPLLNQRNPKKSTATDISECNYPNLQSVSDAFQTNFYGCGVMINGRIFSEEFLPQQITPIPLKDIRHTCPVEAQYFLNGSTEKWEYLKSAKKVARVKPNGTPYTFSEGGMSFPDDIEKPARTMLTSESSVNRSSHVVEDSVSGKLRVLTPIECERLNGFPDDWTNTGMPHKFRYFTMGNALVVPIITKIADRLLELIAPETSDFL